MEIQGAHKQKVTAQLNEWGNGYGVNKFTVCHMPKISFHNILRMLVCIMFTSISAISAAETWGPFTIVEPKPISELWLNPGFYTFHFQNDKGLNGNNLGFGGEYRYSTTSSIMAGEFHNSDWQTTHYLGWYWHPLALGPVSFGATVSGMDGYPRVVHGGWFPAVLPVASVEYKNIGLNMVFVPNYKERLYGGLSLQLKVKVY